MVMVINYNSVYLINIRKTIMKYIKPITKIILSMAVITQINAGVNPEQFTFQDTTAVDKENVESNLVTIKGLENEETLKLRGVGAYMLNGVYMGREESKVKNGDQVRLIHEAMEEDGAKVSTVLIVGETYDVFTTQTHREK
jgi:hypothetical protein